MGGADANMARRRVAGQLPSPGGGFTIASQYAAHGGLTRRTGLGRYSRPRRILRPRRQLRQRRPFHPGPFRKARKVRQVYFGCFLATPAAQRKFAAGEGLRPSGAAHTSGRFGDGSPRMPLMVRYLWPVIVSGVGERPRQAVSICSRVTSRAPERSLRRLEFPQHFPQLTKI